MIIVDIVVQRIDLAALERRDFAPFAIDLPVGRDMTRGFGDVGRAVIDPDHVELENVHLWWGFTEDISTEKAISASTVGLAQVTLDRDDFRVMAFVRWACGDVKARLRVSVRRQDGQELFFLASRIARSISCHAKPTAPKLALRFAKTGYRHTDADADPQIARFASTDGSTLSLAWSMDTDYERILRNAPDQMFAWIGGAETETRYERGTVWIADDQEWFFEVVTDGTRRIVSATSCRDLQIWIAIGYTGPVSIPRRDALEVIGAARCP
jgi:hypothetical protein